MREHHGSYQADAFCDGGGGEIGDRSEYIGCEEECAKGAFGKREFPGEEVGYPGEGGEAGGEGVESEEEGELEQDEARGGGNGGPDGFALCW